MCVPTLQVQIFGTPARTRTGKNRASKARSCTYLHESQGHLILKGTPVGTCR